MVIDIIIVLIGLISGIITIGMVTYMIEVGILRHSHKVAISEAKGISFMISLFIILCIIILLS